MNCLRHLITVSQKHEIFECILNTTYHSCTDINVILADKKILKESSKEVEKLNSGLPAKA